MRASRIVSGFASWRWMPCCALIAGSLLYVALIVLVVPNSLGKLPRALSVPVGPQNDTLTSDALGNSASHPLHRGRTPAAHPPGTPNVGGLGHALGAAAAPPPRHLNESRAAALGAPAMTQRPSPPVPPPAPAPPPQEPEPAAAPTPDEPAPPPAQPHPAIRPFFGGMHAIAPHVAPTVANGARPADDNNSNTGGTSNDDGPR